MYLEKDQYLFKIFGNSSGQVFLRKTWFDLEFQTLYLFFFSFTISSSGSILITSLFFQVLKQFC